MLGNSKKIKGFPRILNLLSVFLTVQGIPNISSFFFEFQSLA